jgi:hypothetical protein
MVTLLPLGSVMVPPLAAVMACVDASIVPMTVTVVEEDAEESATLVASISTVFGVGTTAGAV